MGNMPFHRAPVRSKAILQVHLLQQPLPPPPPVTDAPEANEKSWPPPEAWEASEAGGSVHRVPEEAQPTAQNLPQMGEVL